LLLRKIKPKTKIFTARLAGCKYFGFVISQLEL
jgi:hypothetical protein